MNVKLRLDVKRGVFIVPVAAVQRGPQGTFVYVVQDGVAKVRPVSTGVTQGTRIEITEGLSAGQQVVTDGGDKLARRHQSGRHTNPARQRRAEKASMSPSRPFILRPVATSLLMAGILLAGFIAYRQLPVSALPQVDYPTIQILTFYPGASPEVMASSVTAPLERQFGQVPGLETDDFHQFGRKLDRHAAVRLNLNIDIAEQEVQASINSAGTFLPRDLPNPPIYSKVNPADAPILTLALTSNDYAAIQSAGFGGYDAGAEDLAAARSGAGELKRRPEAGGPDTGESDGAGRLRT